ncbi:uncharacterized protein TRIADDRAFT_21144 [Trichoplax adhaerens]|uniref:Mitochondrial dicarboxylate carrier n=1 Tax=Trichoplax adhaerens TaxID=10228 RepID=B3RMT7_TRIAD|nr:hypothetical protein TRIADDRAFT_21144 [Trichoplax adhaerens]EDV27331.1 hypothetical protein TRIADDRAFT_21144 [Trichoplax adhaerens]|eukprot:XP_002109165.1 hypothetical protein TRIADDRAFT_21144 [Trichoplax adhaerens]
MPNQGPRKVAAWYDGGLAGAAAACFTHPLDLVKVHLQTQQQASMGASRMAINVVKTDGITALYTGLSASVMRQLTYSTARFAIYDYLKTKFQHGNDPLPFIQKIGIAAVGGAVGGIVGNPADMVNVRMQNDVKIPKENRRNYRHVFDGLRRVAAEEGVPKWFTGVTMTASRAILMTIAQVAVYDQAKQMLLTTGYFVDNPITHFTASTIAGTVATTITQPTDVMKTRLMNAKPGEFRSIFHCILFTAKSGPLSFFKGYVPAWVRLAPHTILTFLFYEQIRRINGYIYTEK